MSNSILGRRALPGTHRALPGTHPAPALVRGANWSLDPFAFESLCQKCTALRWHSLSYIAAEPVAMETLKNTLNQLAALNVRTQETYLFGKVFCVSCPAHLVRSWLVSPRPLIIVTRPLIYRTPPLHDPLIRLETRSRSSWTLPPETPPGRPPSAGLEGGGDKIRRGDLGHLARRVREHGAFSDHRWTHYRNHYRN